MNRPLFELKINANVTDDLQVDYVAGVDKPAIERNFLAFDAQNFVEPNANESKDNFISRCIAYNINEGKDEQQATAICYSVWDEHFAADTYDDYPKEATENAKIALRWAEENGWGSCGTPVGKQRANQLANREPLSRETIARMSAFERHRENSQKELGDGCGRLMWLAWGGDAGIEWAKRKLEQIDKEKFVEDVCPIATQDIKVNLTNRQTAINTAHYGPLNPNLPNDEYWTAKGKQFNTTEDEAKKSICGNCSFFNVGKKIKDCIAKGIGNELDPYNVIDAGELGYCEAFDFKCASKRTCDAWVVGGPVTMKKANTNFAEIKDEERIVFGAAMIPNLKIYRKDGDNEFDVFFSAETIKEIAVKFFAKGFQNNFNIMHDAGQQMDGVVFFQSVIKDDTKGIQGLQGDYPNGTWFLGAKINNDEVWNKIKSGEIKGFSVEGLFNYKQVPTEQEMIAQLKNAFNENLSNEMLLNKIISIVNGTI